MDTVDDSSIGILEYSRIRINHFLKGSAPGAAEFTRLIEGIGDTPYYVPRVVSTNDLLKSQIRNVITSPRFVVSDGQTRGKGTGDRIWVDRYGQDVIFSFAVDIAEHPRRNLLSLLAGAAAAENISSLTGVDILIKWPNDLVVGRRKLGGILIEVVRSSVAIVGVGINIRSRFTDFPEDLKSSATSLIEEMPGTVAPNNLCWNGLLDRLPILIAAAGGAFLAAATREHAVIDKLVGILSRRDRTPGTLKHRKESDGSMSTVECRGIDLDTGELIVRESDGSLIRISSAADLVAPGSNDS